MLQNYFKIAHRSLRNKPLFSFINIFGLALGLSVSLLLFIWVQNELSFDQYHKDSDKTYVVVSNVDVGNDIWRWPSLPLAAAPFIEEIPEVESLTLLREVSFDAKVVKLPNNKRFEEKDFAYVGKDWFEEFNFEIVSGSIEEFQGQLRSIALTESLAQKYYGSKNPLGRNLEIDSIQYTVQLLIADPPSNSSFHFNAYLPFEALWRDKESMQNEIDWGNFNYTAFIKCNQGSDLKAVEDKLTAIFDRNKKNNNTSISLSPLSGL